MVWKDVECVICGKIFNVIESRFNRGSVVTCSMKCRSEYQKFRKSKTILISCVVCGDTFTTFKSRLNTRKVCHNPMCLKEVRSINIKGEKCRWWQGGISNKKYCEKFDDHFKERVRAFFNYTCLICGAPQGTEKLGIHHIHYNKRACCDNSPRLFAPVCRSCHARTNSHRGYWEDVLYNKIMLEYDGKSYLSKEEMRIRKKE